MVSPDGVAPSRMVGVSASVNLPLHHKVQKFSSGTGSPRWSRKKGRKTVVVWCGSLAVVCIMYINVITGTVHVMTFVTQLKVFMKHVLTCKRLCASCGTLPGWLQPLMQKCMLFFFVVHRGLFARWVLVQCDQEPVLFVFVALSVPLTPSLLIFLTSFIFGSHFMFHQIL